MQCGVRPCWLTLASAVLLRKQFLSQWLMLLGVSEEIEMFASRLMGCSRGQVAVSTRELGTALFSFIL